MPLTLYTELPWMNRPATATYFKLHGQENAKHHRMGVVIWMSRIKINCAQNQIYSKFYAQRIRSWVPYLLQDLQTESWLRFHGTSRRSSKTFSCLLPSHVPRSACLRSYELLDLAKVDNQHIEKHKKLHVRTSYHIAANSIKHIVIVHNFDALFKVQNIVRNEIL